MKATMNGWIGEYTIILQNLMSTSETKYIRRLICTTVFIATYLCKFVNLWKKVWKKSMNFQK